MMDFVLDWAINTVFTYSLHYWVIVLLAVTVGFSLLQRYSDTNCELVVELFLQMRWETVPELFLTSNQRRLESLNQMFTQFLPSSVNQEGQVKAKWMNK